MSYITAIHIDNISLCSCKIYRCQLQHQWWKIKQPRGSENYYLICLVISWKVYHPWLCRNANRPYVNVCTSRINYGSTFEHMNLKRTQHVPPGHSDKTERSASRKWSHSVNNSHHLVIACFRVAMQSPDPYWMMIQPVAQMICWCGSPIRWIARGV